MDESSQKLTLLDRKNLLLTGVEEVVSFDESTIRLHTCLGTLTIQGQGLHLKALSLEGGQIQVDGSICSLDYEETGTPGSWLSRFFS